MTPITIEVAGLDPKPQPRARSCEEEVWSKIPGFDDRYQVSSLGRVLSSARTKTGKPMRLSLKSNGYVQVGVIKDARSVWIGVHRLVALAFLGDGEGLQVNHKNGVKHDNRLSNLEWVTAADNYRHAIETGLAPLGDRNGSRTQIHKRPRGDSSPTSKLNSQSVLRIRQARLAGRTLASIASEFGICFQQVHNIVTGKAWAHLS